MVNKILWVCIIIIFHGILVFYSIKVETLFIDKLLVSKEYYEKYFVPEYSARIGADILCDSERIFSKKEFKFHSIDRIEYLCSNGTAVVYRFYKNIGRDVMLANWHQR